MKLTHHVPAAAFRSAKVDPDYQAQVDKATAKSEAAYARAQRRLIQAEERQARAQEKLIRGPSRKVLIREAAVAAELVELRREELLRLQATMQSIPASVAHRGRGGYRPIPQPGSPL